MSQNKFKIGDLICLNFSRTFADINSEYFSFTKGQLFLIISKNIQSKNRLLHEYTIQSISGSYIEMYTDVLEDAFSIVE
jgi:hypothetical protein